MWHFQAVHHGVWDYDFPAAPNLLDINVDGRPIKAIAQVSKQGFTYVFDRETGEPVWPIEERPVETDSDLEGEVLAPTQPFPTKPPPFEYQGVTVDDLVDFTPEIRALALEAVKNFRLGPLFTPPTLSVDGGMQGTIQRPHIAGGPAGPGPQSTQKLDSCMSPQRTDFPSSSTTRLTRLKEAICGIRRRPLTVASNRKCLKASRCSSHPIRE